MPHCRDPIRGKAQSAGVLADGALVRSEVDTVDFVARHVTLEPLDLRAHRRENVNRLPGDLSEFGLAQIAGPRDVALNDEFRHMNPAGWQHASMAVEHTSRRLSGIQTRTHPIVKERV
jgi:hypothetical protein